MIKTPCHKHMYLEKHSVEFFFMALSVLHLVFTITI